MEMDTCRVDIIVPIYGTLGFVKACVQAVLLNTETNFTLFLADDMSPGDEVKEYLRSFPPGKRIWPLFSEKRRGFGGNNNWAAKHGNAEFICFLNSDTEVREGWLSAMLRNMSEPEVGIVGAKLLFPPAKGGTIQHCGVGRNNEGLPFHPGYGARASLPMADVRRYLNAVTAACMLVRRSCWDELGGFDPIFGLGQFEDVDLCWRARKLDWKIVYEPKAVVTHYEHGSGEELLEGHLRKMGILMNRWGDMGSDKHLFGME